MKNSSRRRSKGTGKSILSFFFGMIMGVVLFVGAIAGTLYALVATIRVGDVTDMAGLEDGTIFDADSEINDKTLLEIYKMLAGEDFSNMTLNEIAEKYGLTGKLALAENEDAFIDVSVLFDVPLNEIGNQWAELILNQITLNKIGGLTNLQFDEYGLPILDDNLNVPIIDAIDNMLPALSGELTLRQIEDNFGIQLKKQESETKDKIFLDDDEFKNETENLKSLMNKISALLEENPLFNKNESIDFLMIQNMIEYLLENFENFIKYSQFIKELLIDYREIILKKLENDLKTINIDYETEYESYESKLYEKKEYFYLNIYRSDKGDEGLIASFANALEGDGN